MNRKKVYERKINEFLSRLNTFQNKGCFFYPYLKKQTNYINARWQEAVYTLALSNHKKNKKKIIQGINFWCRIQNKKGYFSELSKYDQSFSATAFSLNAIVSAIEVIGIQEKWKKHLIKAGKWLVKNNENIYTNQQAAATLALLKLSNLLKIKTFRIESEKRLNSILKKQKGFYPENKGFDLGYSTITIDSLAQYYQITKDKRIIKSVEQFCNFIQRNKNLKNTRSETNWVIINGFEILAPKSKIIKNTLKSFLQNYDFIHLPDNRHIATDLYRLILAHKNTKTKLGKVNLFSKFEKRKEQLPKQPIHITLLRPFGMHKIRKIYHKLR